MTNEERIRLLIEYLQTLAQLSNANVKVFDEIRRTIAEIDRLLVE